MIKKCLLMLSVLLNTAFIFYACTKQPAQQETGYPGLKSAKATGLHEPLAPVQPACNAPFNGMPYNDVVRMINNYNTGQRTAIYNNLGLRDSKNCWFGIAKIKNFICQAESILQQSGCNVILSGIRFHYAAHDQQSLVTYGLPPNYNRKHTLIMLPTFYDSVRKEHFDFNPFLITNTNCLPIPLTRQLQEAAVAAGIPPGNIYAEDTGQLGPPDEDGISRKTGTAQRSRQ